MRVVVPTELAASRRKKMVLLQSLAGEELLVDGYNVLITVESLLGNKAVYLCDDGFLRDTQGIFRKYKSSELTGDALSRILELLASAGPAKVEVLLDQQISMSGALASRIRALMEKQGLSGTASTARDVDRRLKSQKAPVATSDGQVIDAVSKAVDLPAEISRRLHIKTRSI